MRLRECISALKKLDSEIGKFHPPSGSDRCGFNQVLRNITPEEWKMIEGIIRQYELPCRLACGAYGFAFLVHEHGKILDAQPPKMLIAIEDRQFPFPSAQKGAAGQEETLRKIKPIVYNKRNERLLKQYGFELLLRPIERYAY